MAMFVDTPVVSRGGRASWLVVGSLSAFFLSSSLQGCDKPHKVIADMKPQVAELVCDDTIVHSLDAMENSSVSVLEQICLQFYGKRTSDRQLTKDDMIKMDMKDTCLGEGAENILDMVADAKLDLERKCMKYVLKELDQLERNGTAFVLHIWKEAKKAVDDWLSSEGDDLGRKMESETHSGLRSMGGRMAGRLSEKLGKPVSIDQGEDAHIDDAATEGNSETKSDKSPETAAPISEQTTAPPTSEQTTTVPTSEQTTVAPTTEQTTVAPTTEQTTAAPTSSAPPSTTHKRHVRPDEHIIVIPAEPADDSDSEGESADEQQPREDTVLVVLDVTSTSAPSVWKKVWGSSAQAGDSTTSPEDITEELEAHGTQIFGVKAILPVRLRDQSSTRGWVALSIVIQMLVLVVMVVVRRSRHESPTETAPVFEFERAAVDEPEQEEADVTVAAWV